jgi:hypothetical protein
MPAGNKIYFAQIAPGVWADWVKVVNINDQPASVQAIVRTSVGQIVWNAPAFSGLGYSSRCRFSTI